MNRAHIRHSPVGWEAFSLLHVHFAGSPHTLQSEVAGLSLSLLQVFVDVFQE